jgi:hypothetical protein
MSAATELRAFAPVADLTVLAAVERAQLQGGGRRTAISPRCLAAHLGFVWHSGTARRLAPQLLALEAAGHLELGGPSGFERRCRLTRRGQNELQGARRAEVREAIVEALPESPQHRTWRHARESAAVGISEFLGLATTEVREAEAALRRPRIGSSGELMQIGNRLQLQLWRLASATHCLREWPEPNERRPDFDKLGRSGFWPFPRREFERWPDERLFVEGGLQWRR